MNTKSSPRLLVCALALAIPTFLLAMSSPPLSIVTPSSFPAANVGANYSQIVLSAGGSNCPCTWSAKPALPAGLSLKDNPGSGQLSGVPTAVGNYSFTLTVVDRNSHVASKAFTLTVK